MKKEIIDVENKDVRKKLRRKYLVSLFGDALGLISVIFLAHARAQNNLSLMIWTCILNTLALIFIITGNFFIASKEYKQIRRLSAQELKEISEELDK
ncbi:hypothetical protein [Lactobacillus helveticus]|nr:hypothetical protein [Lactobacillus helveticus]NRN97600.1 hypothetical protein [Lactobacillus helveticus]NRO09141.1 hypothetical protein [Lactobacillus helveticus]NRO21287.1 hypothetical protein [Lactobacillus helveticus]NRO33604.1 hypothetical protein [Lactobacillus helveticus]NRO41626.1 hypothetical protein [Lactobacillus helveticus]